MTDPIELRTDGPHSPDYTREVGNVLAEAVRVLNYATRDSAPGLECPSDAYTLLGALYTATQRMPQLCDQISDFLSAQARSGRVGDANGKNPAGQASIASGALITAAEHLADVTRNLQTAQSKISGLYVKEDDDA